MTPDLVRLTNQMLLGEGMTLAEAKKLFSDSYIRAALAETQNNVTQAARLLGVSRNLIQRRVQQWKASR